MLENINKKRVRFADPLITKVYLLPDEERKSVWEMVARDRVRFQRRIKETGEIISKVLIKPHS